MPDDAPPPGQQHPVPAEDVRRVAKLARLHLDDAQVSRFGGQLASILGYIDQLTELDVDNVEPLAHPLDLANVLRDDVAVDGMTTDEALANAPQRDGEFFAVPKVLGHDSGGGA
jgi:aspartyl-tRNA(Asn)/glutamyl-tRNA(Gln) amidotransferase subunit C